MFCIRPLEGFKTRSGPPLLDEQAQHGRVGSLAWLPIPLFLVTIAILFILNITARFEPAYLLPVLDIVFLTVVSLFIAYLAGGVPAVLFLGCGMWTLGIACAIAGVFGYLGMDAYVVTVHNCGAFLGGERCGYEIKRFNGGFENLG
jgi:hypothetical protein